MTLTGRIVATALVMFAAMVGIAAVYGYYTLANVFLALFAGLFVVTAIAIIWRD